ncbi:MAG TPA: type III-B CRISPR module-associated protein Cmr5 [Desulfobacteraceae bacterium]|nr:type III-B CRISPR module-associated protein Cmr5 [Desulfobacteraceae bacterium]
MKTLAQRRSEFVLDQLRTVRGNHTEFEKLTMGLPAMILQNGLGHTLAFLLAKAGNEPNDRHRAAFNIIAGWLREQQVLSEITPAPVMRALSSMDQGKYLTGQREALKVLEWVKRYAKAGLFA